MIDFVIRLVPYYGYLPIVMLDQKEVFRGSFKETPAEALKVCETYQWEPKWD